MKFKPLLFLYLLLFFAGLNAHAQLTCPNNIDFEFGALTNWDCAVGTNNGTSSISWTPVAAITGRHTIMSGSGLDAYGNFPVVAPGGGMYSAKVGDNQTGAQMDRIRYTLQVPVGANNYNLIYRYAVVFQDGLHNPNEQSYFRISVTDSATGAPISCNTSTLVSTSNLPGFIQTTPSSNIWYKDWSPATLRIAGLGGHTLYVEFSAADCSLGGHFGYGYVDLNCNGYAVTSANCNGSVTTPLVGPPGFQHYDWYDSSFATYVGAGQTVTVPSPASSNYYNVVITPYPGFGCIDTLTTKIAYGTLTAEATPDTSYLCNAGATAHLSVAARGSAPPFIYSWSPVATLSCASCTTPTATPTSTTAYAVSVTDSIGCVVTDTAIVVSGMSISISQTNILCYGAHNGAINATVVGGRPPYTYSWNTSPVQTTPGITNLGPGTYTVTVRDVNQCQALATVTITQRPVLYLTAAAANVSCAGALNGAINVTATGGTPSYTYSWDTNPIGTTPSITAIGPGTYTCTVTDTNNCVATIIKTITEPPPIAVQVRVVARPCFGLSGGAVTVYATGGTAPLQYIWNTTYLPVHDTVKNLYAGSYVLEIVDGNNCRHSDTISVTSNPLPLVNAGRDAIICRGDSILLTANGATSYSWEPAGYLSCSACVQSFAYPDSNMSFILTGTDVNGCVNKDTVDVMVIQRVQVGVDSMRHICPGDRVELNAFGGESYEWSPGNTLSAVQFPNPVASPDTTTTYRVIITESRCFKDTLEQTVVVMPKPSVQLGADFYGIPGATVKLETIVAGQERITWLPPAGLSCTDCYAPIAALDTNISYIAEVINSYGCTDRDTINIRVSCDGAAIYVANTFTPNNDGQNDYFYPQGLGINSVKRFMVYDRWGEVVFSAVDMPANVQERGWNGTYKNKELPPDVFLFVIETICKDGSPIVLKGDVTLVR